MQWRKGLKLSGEHTVEKLTLDGVKGLRVALGATVHDVLYYMSPIYCQHIIDSVICYITDPLFSVFWSVCFCETLDFVLVVLEPNLVSPSNC